MRIAHVVVVYIPHLCGCALLSDGIVSRLIAKVSLGWPKPKSAASPKKLEVARAGRFDPSLLSLARLRWNYRRTSSHLRSRPSREPEQLYQNRPRSDLLGDLSINILTQPHIHHGFSTRSGCRRRRRRILRTLRPSAIDHAPTILTHHRVALVLSHCADTVAALTRSARHSTRVDSRRR